MVQTLNFINLSSQQAPNDVNWAGLVNSGVQGVLIRLGHGIIRDPCASGHIAKAKQYGLYWHGYHTYEGVVNEPQFTIKNATELGLSTSQYYLVDLTKSSDPFNDYYALHANWLSEGYSTGLLISNEDYLSKFTDSEVTASGSLRWLISDTEPANYDIWQYSSEGTIGTSSVKIGFNFAKTDKLKYNLSTTLTGADINKDPYNPQTPVGGAYIGWGYDTTGLGGGKTIGYSTNGKNFYALIGPNGLVVRKSDGNRIYGTIADQIDSAISANVIPAKSAADSAVSAADAAVASAQVTSDAVSAIASATAEAKQGANEAMSRAESAWDVATGAKEAVTDFDPLVKSAQSDAKQANETAMSAYEQSRSAYDAVQADSSAVVAMQSSMADFREDVASTQSVADGAKADAGKALTQIADTANALSDAKTAFNSGVAEAKQLASTAQTTADSAVESAGENAKALTSQANALSDVKKAMDSGVASATGLVNAAQTTANNAIKSASSVANDLAAVASQAKSNASGITKVTSDVGLLQTTVADNSGNISKIQETAAQIQQAVSDNSGAIVVATQTANSAATVASDAKSNATVAVQTASGASVTAKNAQGDATTAITTAQSAVTQASDAKSNATIAIQTASEASVTATNAQGDASIAKQTASDASVQIKNAQGDISALQTRAGTIEASVSSNSGAIADVQATANQLKASVSDNAGNITVAKQTADSAVAVASDARSNATVAIQTASQASITASNASGQAASAMLTANGAMTTASDAKSDATVAVQTASGASLTATNAQSDATIAKQTASEATIQASNAESDFAQLSIRANKIEANVATNSGTIASVQQTASGLTTTVANIKSNGGGVNLASGTTSDDQSYGDASQTTGWVVPTIATFDNPQAGQQYTISVNTKNNGGSWRIQVYDGTSPTHRVKYLYGFSFIQGQKQTATFTWPSGSNKYLIVQLNNANDGGQITWNSAMLEEGTVAHTWSPAPNDLKNQFTQIKASIDGVTTIINDPKTGMTATYQTASQASLTAQNASGQAVTAVTTAQGAVTTANNAQSDATVAKQTASEASVTASNAAGDASVAKQTASQASISVQNAQNDITSLDARADSLEAFQKDASGNINKLVSRTDGVDQTLTNQAGDISSLQSRAGKLESSMSTANGQISTLQQTANGLTTTVADIKANGGGVNLVKDSEQEFAGKAYWFHSYSLASLNALTPGKTYTISFSAKVDDKAVNCQQHVFVFVYNPSWGWGASASVPISTDYQLITYTFTVPEGITDANCISAYLSHPVINGTSDPNSDTSDAAGTGYIKKFMFEEGTVAHTWSPSHDDLQNQFTQIKASIDGVTTTINDPKTGLNATYQTAQGNASTISNVKGDVAQLQTTASGLTSRVGNLESKTDTQQTAIDQNKTAIALKADQTEVDTLKGNVTNLQAESTTQADEIKNKVTRSDVTGMLTGYATQDYTQSLVTLKADEWNVNLTKLKKDTQNSVTNLSATVDGIKGLVETKAGQSEVTQLSNLVQSKVSSGDFTSTTTQLKNMINQRVQVGNVISQINQEAGGDTLIQVSNGKGSFVLDASNTIMTGKAWIPDAAISSISADKIMLGSSSLYNSDGTLNLVNQSNNLKALIQVKQGLVQNTTQSIISFSSDYNNRAFSVTPVGATITPTLFFERYDQTAGHWLGFTRNEVRRDGLMFHTWDDEGERFFVGCHARFDRNISVDGTINQGTWNGTSGKPEAGILTIKSGNTIWSGSDYLVIGDHLCNSFTNVMARSFSQQSTLSSKTNIEAVDPKYALDLVNRTDILSYQYKADVAQGKTKRYTSMILDDVNDVSKYYAPDEFANEERTGRDDGSAVGYLFLAIQELTRQIKNLEEKING
ncbi:hypothetical protein [Limosilactobacillus fermentum]|uniref:hypothetical protein n=1 Tax=Limosilactobacillus fermentum TaxID=1613 RepID=UPI0022449AFD|nr:hypothetical protein [Limosilactobacillus fermentum]UZM84682.1 hypothetical protein OP867_07290 [Limosilactobacillus fermentum]